MGKECAFCPSTATLTGEHVWSNCINSVLSSPKFTYEQRDKHNVEIKSWQSSKLNLKARVVCAECNRTWMSEIDNNEAKPIQRHLLTDLRPRRIPIPRLISIAIFAFKTAVIGDYRDRKGRHEANSPGKAYG